MSIPTTYLDRILDPVAECFTPGVARRLADLRADAETQARLDTLAEKANQGRLTPEEDAEYKQAIDAIDLLAILQAKARAYLRQHPAASWEAKRTDETRHVESVLKSAGFQQVDAYRYNSASIRVRVVDPRFEGRSSEERDAMVELHLDKLPERTQADIMSLFTFAPSELQGTTARLRAFVSNAEFDAPSPSVL